MIRASLFLAWFLASAPLAAQRRERDDVLLRNDCRLATQILTTGQPAPRRDWALSTIIRCDTSGPAVVAGLWEAIPDDSASLALGIRLAVNLKDQRVMEVLEGIARDGGRASDTRLAALAVLYTYARPHEFADLAKLRAANISYTPAHESDVTFTVGERPPTDPETRLRSLLTGLVGDSDTTVGAAARYLRTWLGT